MGLGIRIHEQWANPHRVTSDNHTGQILERIQFNQNKGKLSFHFSLNESLEGVDGSARVVRLLDLKVGLGNHSAITLAACQTTRFHDLLVVVDFAVAQEDYGLLTGLVDEWLVRAHRGVDNGEPMESDDKLGEHLERRVIRTAMLHAHEVLIEARDVLGVLAALTVLTVLLSDDGENTTHSSLESRGGSLHPDMECYAVVLRLRSAT